MKIDGVPWIAGGLMLGLLVPLGLRAGETPKTPHLRDGIQHPARIPKRRAPARRVVYVPPPLGRPTPHVRVNEAGATRAAVRLAW